MVTVIGCQQARQILEREYNNLLALGTERRLDEVSPGLSLKGVSEKARWLPSPTTQGNRMLAETESSISST